MLLDFEKPIAELESKLASMKQLAEDSKVDIKAAIADLEVKILNLKKETYQNLTRWQRVQLSRHSDRPYTLDYIHGLSDKFIELHGDRLMGDDKAMVGGLGLFEGNTVMFIGQQKGRDTKSRQYRNFGMSNPEGYRKAFRLMRMAEKFNKPVVALVDTPGAFPGIEAEERGQAEAIAMNLQTMATLKVPIIVVVIGEGASGGALAIGVGDRIFMLENTWYSVISPESCSSILWRSWDYKEQAAEALKLTAKDMFEQKLIDDIIPEPLGGAHVNPQMMVETLRNVLSKELKELSTIPSDVLIKNRIDKFSKMGLFVE